MRQSRNHYLNNLWIARKHVGLAQKSVATLLGHHTTSAISEYETGRLLPNLKTALKLAVIYGKPISELYRPMRGEAEREVSVIQKRFAAGGAPLKLI